MARYIAARLLGLLPTLLVISLVSFAITQLTPGDPAMLLLQQRGQDPTGEAISQIRQELGLDQPLAMQYLHWFQRLCIGDLGRSYYSEEPVLAEIMLRLPATLELTLAAMLVALTVALTLGLAAAYRPGGWVDRFSKAYALVAVSLPSYWLGLVLMFVFAVQLQWLPAVGRGSLPQLLLPAISLGFTSAAVHARLLCSGLLESGRSPCAEFALAKGLTAWQVLLRHSLPVSLLPVVTSLGSTFGHMLGGAVLIETVFAWPGLGKLLVDAIFNRDYPLIQGYVLVMAVLYTLVTLSTDLVCAWLDPRLRLGEGRDR